MVVPTNVRAARVTALLAGFQTAKASQVSDFTLAASRRLWTSRAAIETALRFRGPETMDADKLPLAGALYSEGDHPAGALAAFATPTALEWLLKSNYGSYAAPTFTLATQVADDRWLTLGWVEDVAGGTERLVRLRDAWIHRLDLLAQGPEGRMAAVAHYAGRAVAIQALNAGGVTLPADPMSPSDRNPFPAAQVELRRDPAGANVNLRWRQIRLTFDQGLAQKWDMAAGAWDVWKTGKLSAELEFTSDWSDETWAILDNNRAKTHQTFRVKATAEGGRILTCDLANMAFEIDPPGHEETRYSPFRAVGRARGTVTLTLTA